MAFTPTGATVKPALVVKGQKLTKFDYDSTTNTFIATGTGGVTATIKYTNTPPRLTDDYKIALPVPAAGTTSVSLGYIDADLSQAATNSSLFIKLLNEVNASLPATQKLSYLQLAFYNDRTADIQYIFTGGKATINHRVTVTEDAVNKTIILKHQFWHNGTAIIPAQPFLKNIDDKLLDVKGLYVKKESFKIKYTNIIYTFTSASSPFRMTSYLF